MTAVALRCVAALADKTTLLLSGSLRDPCRNMSLLVSNRRRYVQTASTSFCLTEVLGDSGYEGGKSTTSRKISSLWQPFRFQAGVVTGDLAWSLLQHAKADWLSA